MSSSEDRTLSCGSPATEGVFASAPPAQGSPPQLLLVSVERPGERAGLRPAPPHNPGLTPPPGAHWSTPAPNPAKCAAEAVVGRLPPAPGLASRRRRRLSRRAEPAGRRAARGGRGQAGGAALGPRAGTDGGGGGGSRRARSPRAHTHTPPRRDRGHRPPADTRTRRLVLGARSSAHTLPIPGRRGARTRGCAPFPRGVCPGPPRSPQPRGEARL